MQEKIAQYYELCKQLEYACHREWKRGQPPKDPESAENLKLNRQLAKLSDEIAQELARRRLAFDHLLKFSRDPMRTLDQEHEWAMDEIEGLELLLRAEEHPLGLRLEGAYLTRGSESVKLVGDQLELVHVVLKQPGIHKHDVLRLLYPGDSTATVDLLDDVQKHANKKLVKLGVRISQKSGNLDFVLLRSSDKT
jgi:hypothetical protein